MNFGKDNILPLAKAFRNYRNFAPAAQRFALLALGRGRRSHPARKRLRRRKRLIKRGESPASSARFVGCVLHYRHHYCISSSVNAGTFSTLRPLCFAIKVKKSSTCLGFRSSMPPQRVDHLKPSSNSTT